MSTVIDEAAKLQDAVRQQEFRRKHAGYRPGRLAKVRGADTMYEFTSWPWLATDGAYIMARVLEDPTTNRTFKVRREIALVGWGHWRQRMYREGWKAGQAYMRFVQEEWRKERENKFTEKVARVKQCFSPEEAFCALSDLIEEARKVTGVGPGQGETK